MDIAKEILSGFRQGWELLLAADKEAWVCGGMMVVLMLIGWAMLWVVG